MPLSAIKCVYLLKKPYHSYAHEPLLQCIGCHYMFILKWLVRI